MYWFTKKAILLLLIPMVLVLLCIPLLVMAGKVSDGSSIGGVSLENLKNEDAELLLQDAISKWQSGSPLLAENKYETIEIPRTLFQFDVKDSMLQLEEKMARSWSNFFRTQKDVQQSLIVEISSEERKALNLPDYVDVERTLNKALIQAENLSDNSIPLQYINRADMDQITIAEVSLPIQDQDMTWTTVRSLAEDIDEQVLESGSLFSFLETISLEEEENAEEELRLAASGIYQLALQSNIDIIERHAQTKVASYSTAGLDANVDQEKNLDLKLYVTSDHAYTILADIEDDYLKLTLQAMVSELDYEYSVENEQKIASREVYRYNNDLPIGEENIIQQGQNGKSVEVYRITKEEDDVIKDKELIERDFYPPSPTIIEIAVPTSEKDDMSDDLDTEEQIGTDDSDSIFDQIRSNIAQKALLCEEDGAICEKMKEFYENGQGGSMSDFLLFLLLFESWGDESDPIMLDGLNIIEEEMVDEDNLDAGAELPKEENKEDAETEMMEEKKEEKPETAETKEALEEVEKKIPEEDEGAVCPDEETKQDLDESHTEKR